MRADYPLLLRPHLAERVWGGSSLGAGIGEAWDLSVHPHGPCRVANGVLKGRTLAAVAAAAPADFGGPIGLLAKRLDCERDLSVQVHPKKGDTKTESWVVLEARPGSGVYHGFRKPVTRAEVEAAARDGTLPQLLRFLEARAGDCIFVPSGTVHAIGGGLVLFELQQSADTTYRLFDWGRDRELHLQDALHHASLDATPCQPEPVPAGDGVLRLVECDQFRVDRVETRSRWSVDPGETWRAVFLLGGGARVADVDLAPGTTVLVPRAAGACDLEARGSATALVYGP